jgi:MFS family permease
MLREGDTTVPLPAQPFPIAKVSLIGLILLVNNFSMFVIFPFLPFMVSGFFPDLEDRQLGYYAGYLASAFHLGALPSGIVWGSLADRIGRRPVLLLGTIGTLISTILFGLSRSYSLALFSRFLWGALNGNVGVAKTYLSEVCDDKNQAKGFAVIGFAAGAGRLLGPIVGGFFSQPAEKYPEWFGEEGFFVQFEYILPMIIGASLCLIIFITSIFLLEETLPDKNNILKKHGAGEQSLSIFQLVKEPLIATTVGLFAIISFGATMSEEIFSLWLVLQPNVGGFGFNSSQIGTVISVCAPIQLVLQAFLFPYLVAKFGFKNVFQIGMGCASVFISILPFTNIFPRHFSQHAWVGWVLLVVVYSGFVSESPFVLID